MKVLLVDQFGKTTGRDTLSLVELINQNDDIDIEVYISDNTELPKDKNYSVKIVRGFKNAYVGNSLNKAINYLKSLYELYRYINTNHFDIIHLQWFSLPWIEWIYVSILAKKYKIAITVHDIIPFDNRPLEMKCLDKIYSKANVLLVHTKSAKDLFNKKYKAKTPISIITQGFCLKSDYKKINNEKAKAHFGIPTDSVVFLYYGTIRPSKGLDILIKAIHKAQLRNENVFLLAAGSLHRVNEEDLKKLIKKELTEDYSLINIGFVHQEEEQWYFSAADVLCLPYLDVTQSGVAQLGLMYELPIIATKVGEMEDVCRDGLNGIIISPGNVDQLSDAIIKLAGDRKFRLQANNKSKELGEKEFSLRVKAGKVINAYEYILSK